MKILMVNLPFAGHSNPTMGLAQELFKLGHDVGYIHSYEWKERILATGCKFIPYVGTTAEHYKKADFKYWRVAYDTVEAELPYYDLLIYEFLFLPGKSLADQMGKPCVRLFSTFALNSNILREFGLTGGPYVTMIFRYDFIYKPISARISHLFHLKKKDILSELTENVPTLNFIYTIREFQIDSEAFDEKRYRFVGPSLSGRSTPNTGSKIDYSNMSHPIIYISMGTMLNYSQKFYKKCFEAFGDKDLTVIISLGHGIKIESFCDVPQNIKLFSFVPQLEVLENCNLFITHGGMNSVNEAIYFGVPMLVLPIGNDQPTVAKRVEELGLGKKIIQKTATAKDLYNAAITVLANIQQPTLQAMKDKCQNAGGNKYIADTIIDVFGQVPSHSR